MPSLFQDMERSSGIGDERAFQLALELSMLGFNEPMSTVGDADSTADLTPYVNPLSGVGLDEVRSKKSQNMTECVPVPSSEHVAEIVGRQGRHQFCTFGFVLLVACWFFSSRYVFSGWARTHAPAMGLKIR
ncbi:hypothetical protein GWI33_011386 [Rhynchophorus ferrugineus]|uniref:Uncharacterized protein n=1 Tax=Rhynchophorus ferrugineus TaxID=354439 RepID=A0A834IQB1_RHYFE|nr:hypothetical protein GWI33_011386 [Rhynchophorus ferrugineus]